MNILLTGSKGQLGNEISSIIKSGKAEIGAVSDQYKNYKIFETDVAELDICSLNDVRSFCKENKFNHKLCGFYQC